MDSQYRGGYHEIEIVRSLFEFAYGDLDETDSLSIEEIDDDLQMEGIDPVALVHEARSVVRQAIKRHRKQEV